MINSSFIKEEAKRLGFFACGMAKALPVDEEVARGYQRWIAKGYEAGMQYMANNMDKRLDPRLLVPGVKTIAVSYTHLRAHET